MIHGWFLPRGQVPVLVSFLRLYASFVDVILNNMLKNEEGKICDNNIICKFLIFIVTYFYSYISFILLVLGSYI